MPTTNEVLEVVYKINQEMYEIVGDRYYDHYNFDLQFRTDGYSDIVVFLGQTIWGSDEDYRVEIAEDEYEPLENFLKREIKNIYVELGKIADGFGGQS